MSTQFLHFARNIQSWKNNNSNRPINTKNPFDIYNHNDSETSTLTKPANGSKHIFIIDKNQAVL